MTSQMTVVEVEQDQGVPTSVRGICPQVEDELRGWGAASLWSGREADRQQTRSVSSLADASGIGD